MEPHSHNVSPPNLTSSATTMLLLSSDAIDSEVAELIRAESFHILYTT